MWEHSEAGQLLTAQSIEAKDCIYCLSPRLHLPAQAFESRRKRLFVQLSVCPQCGWWTVYRVHQGEHPQTTGIVEGYSGAIGCLKELDLDDISVPLTEVRQYFLARRDSVLSAHPRLVEEVVCSVFQNLGWSARVTAYSGDDWIDVVLDASHGNTIGVQVKRYRKEHRIQAEQIRSLAGALVLGGHTKGVFITTSSFRRGAVNTAKRFSAIGYPIELVNASRFLEVLGIAQRRSFDLSDERIAKYALTPGVHLGSGIEKPYTPGEDLLEREVAAQICALDEWIDLREATAEVAA